MKTTRDVRSGQATGWFGVPDGTLLRKDHFANLSHCQQDNLLASWFLTLRAHPRLNDFVEPGYVKWLEELASARS